MDEQTIEKAAEIIERATAKSKQPRFANTVEQFYGAITRWLKSAKALEQPDYAANSRTRDRWLMDFWHLEPHLAGVLNSIVQIDKNRSWMMTGGRNQVYRYMPVLHNYSATPELIGWRPGLGVTALSFYATDLGAVVEEGRDGRSGPLRALYHTDSTLCRLTGNVEFPLRYNPPSGREQQWTPDDYFRVTSMPSTLERFNGLGFCGVSRAVELAKLMVGIYEHDQEMVGARMPKGLLLLQGIGEQQWADAMKARDSELDRLERDYFGGVAILAASGTEQIDARLVALSTLPASFDMKIFTDLLMYGYALCFGYDPTEFWPVQYGSLGRGRESEVQAMKATGKGGMAFALAFQEQLQKLLPETLQFEFEQRDDEASLLQASVAEAWARVAKALYEAGQMGTGPLLNREQALTLLVDAGVIPAEWTEFEEEAQADDTEARLRRRRDEALAVPAIRRAIVAFPDEPIVRYAWPADRVTVLWNRGADALTPALWRVERQEDESEVLFEEGDVTITVEDVERAIETGARRVGSEFAELLTAPTEPEPEPKRGLVARILRKERK